MSGNVILVAHKCLDYDAKVLLRNLEEFEIPYEETILGFSDSLLASRYGTQTLPITVPNHDVFGKMIVGG